MNKTNLKLFFIAFGVAVSYYALWFVIRNEFHIYSRYLDIPGFVFLFGSLPWSIPALKSLTIVGTYGSVLFTSMGFSINIVLVKVIGTYLRGRYFAAKIT